LSGPCRWQLLQGDGSERSFYRLASQNSSLIVVWSPIEYDHFPNENDSFVYMGNHLRRMGIPVPQIFAYWRSSGLTLMEDLGSTHLQEAVESASGDLSRLYHQALELLLNMQVRATQDLDIQYCFDTPVYDPPFIVRRELEYFKQSFLLAALGLKSDFYGLERDFSTLASRASPKEWCSFFVHRDFQSRNLMLKGDVLHVIDFQGARLGPPQYDLAALLLDPYVQLSDSIQRELLAAYSRRFSKAVGVTAEEFVERYPHVALCRNLQVLAAFAFLTKTKLRLHFAQYIVPAWRQLQRLLAEPPGCEYQGLVSLVQSQNDETVAIAAARLRREAQEAVGSKQSASGGFMKYPG
jgi:aminoglycoside/choline kinase family phosphotransferase